jgi:uncharacterized protein (DUF488 family)
MKITTLGVYGYTDTTFRAALEQAKPGVFVDTRRRRGVRGHQYAFANSQRLQALLEELGIPYIHRLDLAPPESATRVQDEVDHKAGIARHDRDQISPALRDTYQHEVLDHFDSRAFVGSLGNPESVLLFCVEGNPAACHRTLLANRLKDDLGGEITHIVPQA